MTTHTITLARHTAQVVGLVGLVGVLVLGTWDSYGTEQLLLRPGPEWEGLAIDATFHNVPNDEGVTVLADTDGLVPVPPEACIQPSRCATITIRGVQDGVQRISCNLPYVVLDHAQVPGANSTATPSENAQALAQMQDLRDGAVDAKNQAEAARDAAANSAVAAKESETSTGQSATAAKTAQSAAETAKAGAETAQKAAASSASSASTFASTATTQAAAAKSSATTAKASEAAAGKSAQGAAASESAAKAAQTAAETAKANADTAASNAAAKATAAAKSAVAAKESEASAGQSATAAANSATAAAGSATAAAGDAKTASDAAAGAKDAKAAAVAAQKDAAASKAAAANSSAAAKTSEDAAAKSAADADSTANSIKESMTQIAANKEAVSQLKEDTTALQKRQNVLVGSETGNPIAVDDAFAAPLCGMTVYGKSTQDGTPTPDAPVPIVSAGDGGSVAVKVTGANMLEGTKPGVQSTVYGITYTIDENGVLITGTATNDFSVLLHDDNKYRLSHGIYYLTTKGLSPSTMLNFYFINKFSSDVQNQKVTLNRDVEFSLRLQISKGATLNTTVQVSLTRNKITSYSPYCEQLLTLPTPNGLPGIPVTSGGNYTDQNGPQWVCDEVDLERGVKVQRVKVLDLLDSNGFDNDRTWHINTKINFGAGTSYIPVEWFTPVTKCLCNTFPVQMNKYQTGTDADLSIYYSRTGDVISLKSALFNPKGQHATVNEAKAWFTAHPTYLYVPIEPIETPLTPAEIAAYKALTAYAPDTVVQASDGAGAKLEYQRDVNIAIKKLEDAIASMTAT